MGNEFTGGDDPNTKSRLRAGIADILFRLPVIREWLMMVNCKSVSRKSMVNILDKGYNFVINPGGIYEQIRTQPDQEKLIFPPKLGFIELAIKNG